MHDAQRAAVTLLTAVLDDASGYGRVLRRRRDEWLQGAADNAVQTIVEEKDASEDERRVREINVGTYVVDGDFLFPALDKLDPRNAQGEYYLTDIVQMAVQQGRTVSALRLRAIDEGLGINSRVQLAEAERVIRQRIRERWLEAGVTMRDPSSTWIDADVTIGRDTVLYPNVTLEGRTVIGEETVVHSGSRITDCTIGNRVEILDHCVLRESQVEEGSHLGPFVHLRPGVTVRRRAKVGNFVEMKKTELGEGSKANHLSYLGDAQIGAGVNIGAGTITCNYDGWKKFQTVIGDQVFIGSDVQLIAPVTVGSGRHDRGRYHSHPGRAGGCAGRSRGCLRSRVKAGRRGDGRYRAGKRRTAPAATRWEEREGCEGFDGFCEEKATDGSTLEAEVTRTYVWHRWLRGKSRRGSNPVEWAVEAGIPGL